MAAPVRFGPFEFDSITGEITRRDADSESSVSRLPPQPARLLALLVERYPSIVTREEIREAIWPDVLVDFERGLHFCVRQVRQALGESASAPTYIETIPRRGYRWLVEPSAVPPTPSASEPIEGSTATPPPSPAPMAGATGAVGSIGSPDAAPPRWRIAAVAALVFLSAGWWVVSQLPSEGRQTFVTRIAVMPMQPGNEFSERFTDHGFAGNGLAESVLADLMRVRQPSLEVIGPTTTTQYVDGEQPIRELIADLDVDYILNGRFSGDGEGRPRMLAEVVRATDGAHVWVRSYRDISRHENIAQEFLEGLLERLAARD